MLITTRDVAKKLGMNYRTLARYLEFKKIPTPRIIQFGKFKIHCWTPKDIARDRQLTPKIYKKRLRYKGKLIPGLTELVTGQRQRAKSKKKRK